jgi:hypothetical protein
MSSSLPQGKKDCQSAQRQFRSERVISEITGRSVRSLQKDRLLKRGFPYYKINRQVVYDLDECIALIEASRVA